MPFFGKVFAKSLKEYQWLQKSAEDFPDAKTLEELFRKAGLVAVEQSQVILPLNPKNLNQIFVLVKSNRSIKNKNFEEKYAL